MTVTFNGKTYSGEYCGSIVYPPNTYTEDRYHDNKHNNLFTVNASTGEVVSFQYSGSAIPGKQTREDCVAVADELAGQYIKIDEYVTEVIPETWGYTVEYIRLVGDMKANDRISITVSSSGEISYFRSWSLGAFAPENRPMSEKAMEQQLSLLKSAQAEEALAEKIGAIFEDFHEVHEDTDAYYSYSFEPYWLVLLPDGTLGRYYIAVAEVYIPAGQEVTLRAKSTMRLLVKCHSTELPVPKGSSQEHMQADVYEGEDSETGLPLSAYRLSSLTVNHEQVYGDEYERLPQDTVQRVHDPDAPGKVTVDLLPYYLDFPGWYETSLQFPGEGKKYSCYNGGEWDFSVDAQTGELVVVQCAEWYTGQETLASCQEKADSIAGKFGDLNQWEQSQGTLGELYRYVYYRYVPQDQECHWMVIALGSDGGLYSFFRGTLRLPENSGDTYLPQVRALLSDQAYALFVRKRDEAMDIVTDNLLAGIVATNYKNAPLPERKEISGECDVYSMELLILPDGSLGALYNTRTVVSWGDSTDHQNVDILVKCA